jgi:hypothetical protein
MMVLAFVLAVIVLAFGRDPERRTLLRALRRQR